jgi:phosphatidylglycerophosphatase A
MTMTKPLPGTGAPAPVAAGRPRRLLVFGLSSAAGLGYLPKAPGTWGTLAALPIWYACRGLSPLAFTVVVLLVTAFSVLVAEAAERLYGRHDVQLIVIDEVAGMLVTAIGVPFAWPEVLAGFVLFRLFDMTKPQPIRWLDEHVPGGFGVVLDDIAAGVVACGLLHGARVLLGGWW